MSFRSLSQLSIDTAIKTRNFSSVLNNKDLSSPISRNPSRNLSPSVLQNKNNFDSYIKKFHRFKKQSKLTIKNSFLFNGTTKQKSFLMNKDSNENNDYISNFFSSIKKREMAKNDENKICTSITAMKHEILFSDPGKNSAKKDFVIPKKVAQDLVSKIKKLSPKKLTNNLLASSKKNISININNKSYFNNSNLLSGTLKKHNSCINLFENKGKTLNKSNFNSINNTFNNIGSNTYNMQRSSSMPNYFTTSNSVKPTSPNNSMIRSPNNSMIRNNSLSEIKPVKKESLAQKIENMKSKSVFFSRSMTPKHASISHDNFFNENKNMTYRSRPESSRKDRSGKLFELTRDKLFPLYSGSTNSRTFNRITKNSIFN